MENSKYREFQRIVKKTKVKPIRKECAIVFQKPLKFKS
jgi:hypothetical protein